MNLWPVRGSEQREFIYLQKSPQSAQSRRSHTGSHRQLRIQDIFKIKQKVNLTGAGWRIFDHHGKNFILYYTAV